MKTIILWRLLVVALIIGIWQGLSGPVFNSFWVSRPSAIAVWLWHSITTGRLGNDLLVTAKETVYGYLIGAVGGLVLAFALAQSERVAVVLRPFILAIYGIPRIALAPLFVLWFGIALTSKVMMAAMVTLLLVFFNTYEGIRSSDLQLKSVALVLGASRWQLFRSVTLPNASPWILRRAPDRHSPGAGWRCGRGVHRFHRRLGLSHHGYDEHARFRGYHGGHPCADAGRPTARHHSRPDRGPDFALATARENGQGHVAAVFRLRHRRGQRSSQVGSRFSMKAQMPSSASCAIMFSVITSDA